MMVAWMTGIYPRYRDDGQAFEDSTRIGDKARAEWARERRRMQALGAAIQKRADWAHLKQVFDLTGWKGECPLLR